MLYQLVMQNYMKVTTELCKKHPPGGCSSTGVVCCENLFTFDSQEQKLVKGDYKDDRDRLKDENFSYCGSKGWILLEVNESNRQVITHGSDMIGTSAHIDAKLAVSFVFGDGMRIQLLGKKFKNNFENPLTGEDVLLRKLDLEMLFSGIHLKETMMQRTRVTGTEIVDDREKLRINPNADQWPTDSSLRSPVDPLQPL
ncbi:hypothetical protein STEG23_030824 [Scotinomys teguina]